MAQLQQQPLPPRDSDSGPMPARQAQTVPDHGLDALLDEIDSTLATNAETFVRSFVQKGGQ